MSSAGRKTEHGRQKTAFGLGSRADQGPWRPLFPKGLHNDIQITITVLSADKEHSPDILGMVGASAALSVSQIPFDGPIGASRLSYKDGEYTVNPTYQQAADSQLSLIVASNWLRVV